MLDYPVTTPENVRFHYTLAGPGTRLLAWLLDLSIVLVLLSFLGGLFGIAATALGGYAGAAFGVAAFALLTGYWIVLEHRWNGRTVGKRMFGLRVVGERGLRLEPAQVVLRNLLRVADMLPAFAGVGAAFMVLHPQHRRLGDLVAGTLVIRERRVPAPEKLRGVLREGAGPVHEAVLSGEARRRIRPEVREFLLDLALRRDALDDDVRHGLFRETAADLRALTGLEGEGPGMSDEKLVLLITAELFERGAR